MWALIVDGKINRVFKVPTAFKHPTTGIQYPRNWLTLATTQEKSDAGFIEITFSGSHGNDNYYTNSESAPVYDASAGTVVITKNKTAKNLTALKTEKISSIENQANSLMSPTDWYVTRKSETSTAIPSNVTAYRTACRLVCNSTKTAIGNASDLAGLTALYENATGISDPDNFTVDGSQTSVVNTTSNAITKNGHGLSNDEMVRYSSGVDGSGNSQNPIGGLVDGNSYYVFGKTVNTFKLSHTNSHMGDAAAISLTGVGGGSDHKFTSNGIPPVGASMPSAINPAYDIE